MVEQLFLAVPWGCLWFVIVVFSDHAHLLFLALALLYSSLVSFWFCWRADDGPTLNAGSVAP